MKAKDYNMRLAGYTNRADAFARCMTEHGYVLDEKELDARLTHFEQVKNADRWEAIQAGPMRIEEQELRVNPEVWRQASRSNLRSPYPLPQAGAPLLRTLKFPPILQI